jgi:hypothetical protein
MVVGIYSHVELPLTRLPDHGASANRSDVPTRFVSLRDRRWITPSPG